MQKFIVGCMFSLFLGQAYAGFIPDEPPLPTNPNTSEKANVGNGTFAEINQTPVANAWIITIPSTPTAATGQLSILRKNNLPAYIENQGGQTLLVVGPELVKSKLLQEQKIVLELLNTAGTIVPYQID